ncbi:Crp/Fnr family transcriptional regulator [Anaerosporobacter faecicola]|uniref:Crp/Fnr family transcriptional regulator n=1 Tax=Anaerosporobacter faecicola TaxID=2718714 RepID=UPI001438F0FD|nr:Crp/Fnr family transcriptional regulator [Anaerosporobacter faecicola]
MVQQQYIPIIQASKLFDGISSDEIVGLLPCLSATEQSYKKDNYIFHTGDTTSKIGLILSGCAHLVKEDYWGNHTILSEVMPGEYFGEAYACLKQEAFQISCVATEATTILFFDMQKVVTVCSSACHFHTRLIQNLMKALARKNVFLMQKLDYISQRSTKDKLLAYLSAQATKQGTNAFTIPFNRQQLADYLSVDRSAMSNELCKLRDEGLLTFHKNSFTLTEFPL